ncbi:ABC transporter permease subunit, partial [Acinetobacter baumannii]
ATSWQMLVKLRLPWALPHIFSGLRVSTAIAGIGAVAGEWAGAQKGLGVLMVEMRKGADIAGCFAALLCLIVLSLLSYFAVSMLEKICL